MEYPEDLRLVKFYDIEKDKGNLTITEESKIIEVSILSKIEIQELLDVPDQLTQNQNVNELLLNF